MNIVIFGLAVSSSWGNGHAALWRGLIRGLLADGHRRDFFERDVPFYAQNRDLTALPPGGRLVLYPDWTAALPRRGRALDGADVGMVTSYCPDALAATALIRDERRALCCFYDLDTPVTLARLDAGESVDYLGPDGLAAYDLVLSYTGGGALEALRDRLGARRVVPIYGSVDPALHRPVARRAPTRPLLSYLGTYAADRQAALEALFVAPARLRPADRFVIGGAQYPPQFPWTDNIWFVRHLPPDRHPAFYCSSRMTLNVTRAAMARMGHCPSGRLFEAASCGTPILTDAWDGLDAFFTPGEEILVARDTADAMAALDLPDADAGRASPAAPATARWPSTPPHAAPARWSPRSSRPAVAHALMWGIIPAAGQGTRIQPLAFSKELLPIGSRVDERGVERPRAVSEYLVERMVRGGADKICFVISPWKSDILQYYGGSLGDTAFAYVVQNPPPGCATRSSAPCRWSAGTSRCCWACPTPCGSRSTRCARCRTTG